MADNYTQFSEVIAHLSDKEADWWKDQLQMICVIDGQEYPVDELPEGSDGRTAEWRGCRGLRDLPDFDPAFSEDLEFQFEFVENDRDAGWGRHLWLYSEDHCNLDHVAHLVQKFLKQFRPKDCWSLTYSVSCSKPRAGEFGGGAIFVTAENLHWLDSHSLAGQEQNAFAARKHGTSEERQHWGGPVMVLQPRELATVLAALRHWQATVVADGLKPALRFPHFDEDTPLSADEIDELCDQLNGAQEPCECELPGYFCSGVPGVIARMENAKLAAGATVERCDHCRRYPTDEAARQKLVELGLV